MVKRLTQLAAMAVVFGLVGCGSVGQNNTRTRAAQTIDTKSPTVGTKHLQNRSTASANKITKGQSTAAKTTGQRYVQNTGASKATRRPGR